MRAPEPPESRLADAEQPADVVDAKVLEGVKTSIRALCALSRARTSLQKCVCRSRAREEGADRDVADLTGCFRSARSAAKIGRDGAGSAQRDTRATIARCAAFLLALRSEVSSSVAH